MATQAKRKLDLGTFNEIVLPSLRTKFSKNDELQKHIGDTYEVFELVDGKEASVTISVAPDVEKPEDKPDIKGMVDSAVKAALAEAKATVKTPAAVIEPEVKVLEYGGPLKAFKGTVGGKSASERAYRFGMWALAGIGKQYAKNFCAKAGISHELMIESKGQTEGVNTDGGYFVPEEFSADYHKLVLEYGVARRVLRVRPMVRDTLSFPRRTGGLTAYFVGEAAAGTASKITMDQVRLVARKAMVLDTISSEVNEDTIIPWADELADESARALAYLEDLCAFSGDGSATYSGIVGLRTALTDMNGVDNGGGIVLGAGNAYSELTLANFHSVIARVPLYARANARWIASPTFHDEVMQKLQTAAGGNTVVQIANGGIAYRFLGYPVELANIMPTTEANSQVAALFGDFAKAGSFGDRRQIAMSLSEHATVGGVSVFETDQLAFKVTERFDINIHDIGTATVAGPVVGLITAAS